MFHVYTPENWPTPGQAKDHDNKYIFSLCSRDSHLLDCIYPEGENLVISLDKRADDKRLVAVKLDNCNNDSFKKWIKYNESYDSDKVEGITYTMYFKVPVEKYDEFDDAWNILYKPKTPESISSYCMLL